MLPARRIAIASGLAVVTLVCWAWIVPMARDMYGPMSGPSAWMMTPAWDARYVLFLWLMWAVMMAAMMLPSAMPLLLLYDRALRARAAGHAVIRVYVMAAGYLFMWAGFSVGAVALQRLLSAWLVLTPMMEMASTTAIGITLLLAGAYQLMPAKRACLHVCRSPLAFVMTRWRDGAAGAFRMGVEHGAYCLGCCWALMLLLFAGGVMNLTVVIGLTAIVLTEKLTPIGVHASRALGAAMIAAGVWFVLR